MSEPVSKATLWTVIGSAVLVILVIWSLGPHNPAKEEAQRNADAQAEQAVISAVKGNVEPTYQLAALNP